MLPNESVPHNATVVLLYNRLKLLDVAALVRTETVTFQGTYIYYISRNLNSLHFKELSWEFTDKGDDLEKSRPTKFKFPTRDH